MLSNTEKTMEKVVALCKARGFVYPGSEIYGGLSNTWDYGPLGVEFKNNVKRAWWKKFVQESPYNVGLDSAILMNPQTWVASGHVGGFSDPLMDCKECKERFRADKIIEDCTKPRIFEHPAILGAQIIHRFSQQTGKPALLVNPPDTDEFQDLARVSGIKGIYRGSHVHVLNQKEVAMRAAKELGKTYEECSLVVCHVGGGLSITAQQNGRIIDGNDVLQGEGPMAPNRSGNVPLMPVIRMCFSGEYTQKEVENKVSKTGGWLGLAGTDSALELERRIGEGDQWAELVFDAMAYQLAKNIGSYACVLRGKVDAVVMTGGVSNSKRFVDKVKEYAGWVAPFIVYGGDFEMEALASGAIRYLTGAEAPKEYTGIPVWSGFSFEH